MDAESPIPPNVRATKGPTFEGVQYSVDGIAALRAKAPKLPLGVAAKANCDDFKRPSLEKPKAKRWDGLLSAESLARYPCSLKATAKYLRDPRMISLGSGLPSSTIFPIEQMDITLSQGPGVLHDANALPLHHIRATKDDIAEERSLYGTMLQPLVEGVFF